MADTRFTALGLSGSGKTCYVLGMYYEMCVGVKGFTLTTENETASLLETWMDKLDDETGADRFPSGTALNEFKNYSFNLSYHNENIMSFDWLDYGGRTLNKREENPEVFEKLNESIRSSTTLYIFIDGDLLCEEETERKIRNVKRKCAKTINPYITQFVQENGSESLPPIVFIITKFDICKNYLNGNKEINEILFESFSSIFGKDNIVYVVAVSLGEDISDDNYSGEVEPVNIHIPFFIGIYHDFFNYCMYIKSKIEEADNESQRAINSSQAEIDYQNSRWFFTNYDKINSSQRRISEAKSAIKENKKTLQNYKRLLNAVAGELMRVSNNFIFIDGGREADFSIDAISQF